MFYPVKVYKPNGELKKIIDTETLSRNHWKEVNIDTHVVKELKTRETRSEPSTAKKKSYNPPITICSIWIINCRYKPCNKLAVKRSFGGRYCSPDCLRLEANRKRRVKK